MNKNNYTNIIQKAKTFEDLEALKQGFLAECERQHNKIAMGERIMSIKSFGDIKMMFESLIPSLLGKKEGKTIIRNYINTIKENQELTTLFGYHEGLKDNNTPESKKHYITEALSLSKPLNEKKLVKGLEKLVKTLCEAVDIIEAEEALKSSEISQKQQIMNESLQYLATTKKKLNNLNEYMNKVEIVSDFITESKTEKEIDVDNTLEEISNSLLCKESKDNLVDKIFNETEDKEKVFNEQKSVCLEMIKKQKSCSQDAAVVSKLNKMENKLNERSYNYDTYTTDMLHMTDLQNVLK